MSRREMTVAAPPMTRGAAWALRTVCLLTWAAFGIGLTVGRLQGAFWRAS